MKVRMNSSWNGHSEGSTPDVDDAMGKRMIDSGHAVAFDDDNAGTSGASRPLLTTGDPNPEQAEVVTERNTLSSLSEQTPTNQSPSRPENGDMGSGGVGGRVRPGFTPQERMVAAKAARDSQLADSTSSTSSRSRRSRSKSSDSE